MMKKLLSLLLIGISFSCNPALGQSSTTHFDLTQPAIGNTTTWGLSWNSNATIIDDALWNASGGLNVDVNDSSSASTITLTNPLASVQNVALTAPGQGLVLPAMNATSSMIVGGVLTVNNVGSDSFEIFAQDGTTSVLLSLAAGATAYITLLTDSTANGTFQTQVPFPFSVTVPVTQGGTGTSTTFTQGSVVFAGASGIYNQDNSNFFWDATNHRLGIGTATPTVSLQTIGAELVGSTITAGGVIESTSGGFEFPDSTMQISGAGPSSTIFTVSGTFTTPSNSSTATIWKYTVVGGGGGGAGGAATNDQGSGGGGAGAAIIGTFTGVAPSTSIGVVIGDGGAGGNSSGSNGSNGVASSIGTPVSVTANPGAGSIGGNGFPGAPGGTASSVSGALNIGGGGGGAPGDFDANGIGGVGGNSIYGGGGVGGSSVHGFSAQNGNAPGAGGGGGGPTGGGSPVGQGGGSGAGGVVVIQRIWN